MKNNYFTHVLPALFLFLIVAAPVLFAQKITGMVESGQRAPLEFVAVTLLKASDSALVKGAATDAAGMYEFTEMTPGAYIIRCNMVGFRTYTSAKFDFDGKTDLKMEKITISASQKEMDAVEIVARKPLIEIRADRTILNVDASPTNSGLNALDLLRKSPGVSLDKDENISLKGKQNVIIQINGKIVQMSGQDLAQFLKSLNSSDLEAVEIISNPGAKYDAEGGAGVINLKLKKDKKLGTNGSVSIGVGQGNTTKEDASISLNHRDTKLNVYGSASIYRGQNDNTMNLDNQIGDRFYNQATNMYWYARPQNGRIGADYSPDKQQTFGVLITGGLFLPNNGSTSTTQIGSGSRVDSLLVAQNQSARHNANANFNLNYRFADTSGRELTFDLDYNLFRDSSVTLNQNFYRTPANDRTLSSTSFRMFAPRHIDIRSFKADYDAPVHLLGTKNKFGAGLKITDVATRNNFIFNNVINDLDVLDVDRSNDFTYKERILAGYVNFNFTVKKLSVQLGLRAENTKSSGDLVAYKPVDANAVDSNYTNFFPSAAFSYELSKNHTLNLTFRRSVDRPRYQDLNPFEFRLDELSFRKGNPFLRPQYTNSVELGWLILQRANLSVSYAKTTDAYAEISDQGVDPVSGKQYFFIQKRNLAANKNFGVSLSTPIPVNSWWNGNANLNYTYSQNTADYGEGKIVDLKVSGASIWMQNVFTLSKTWTAELSGWGNVGGNWGAYINRPSGVLDIGASKKLWGGSGTLKLSFTDVFRTSAWSAYTDLGALHIDARGTWEGRQVKANFTYRFGNKQVQNARRRSTSSEDEKKRADGGGGGTPNQ